MNITNNHHFYSMENCLSNKLIKIYFEFFLFYIKKIIILKLDKNIV